MSLRKKKTINVGSITRIAAAISAFHSTIPVPRFATSSCCKPKRERRIFRRVQVDERTEEIVPGPHEAEQGDGHNRRPCRRENDAPVDAQSSGTVHEGRFIVFTRNGQKELAEEGKCRRASRREREQSAEERCPPTRDGHTTYTVGSSSPGRATSSSTGILQTAYCAPGSGGVRTHMRKGARE